MKNFIVVVSIMLSSSFSMACESNKFNIYYFPLEMDFYVPTSREDIMKNGINFEIDSCLLNDLFRDVYGQKGVKPQPEDYTGLRIMVINKKDHNELFITTDKVVLSLAKKKRYNIDVKVIDMVLKEFIDFIDNNKLDSR